MKRILRTPPWLAGLGLLVVITVTCWWGIGPTSIAADSMNQHHGRVWTTLQGTWGTPACSAAQARLGSRTSADGRTSESSRLVIPHAELRLVDAAPAFGPGSRPTNRVLVFTMDPTVRDFLQRVAAGTLRNAGEETRIAVKRAAPVRVVEIDARGLVRGIEHIRPVFVTHHAN